MYRNLLIGRYRNGVQGEYSFQERRGENDAVLSQPLQRFASHKTLIWSKERERSPLLGSLPASKSLNCRKSRCVSRVAIGVQTAESDRSTYERTTNR